MTRSESRALKLVLGALLFGALAAAPQPATAVEITFRKFTTAAAMGPPAEAYAAKLQALTAQALGSTGEVRFVSLPGLPGIPSKFSGNLVSAVAAGAAGGGFDAAYTSGSELNKAWGFIYNSGVPFGPGFDEYLGFLFGKSVDGQQTGLELLQSILDKNARNVVAVPIVANAEQVSGYFPQPIGNAHGVKGIGLVGLCQSGWRFRYLTPGENVLTQACDNLVAQGVIPVRNISFVQAIPGGGSLVDAVKLGALDAFEFATPYDDVSQLFTGVDNPGTVGLKYLHSPGWQQQFLVTWMLVNKQVWEGLSPVQRALAYTVGRENMLSSYGENMQEQGPALNFMLTVNDGLPAADLELVAWPEDDQERMRDATIDFLLGRAVDPAMSALDRQDYATILEAFRKYVGRSDQYWDTRAVDAQMRFRGWVGPTGEKWVEKAR